MRFPFQIGTQFDPKDLVSLNILIRQGLSLSDALKQKNVAVQKSLNKLIITPAIHKNTPFEDLLNKPLNQVQLIDAGKASFLCRVTSIRPAKKLSFYDIEKALENKLKNARINQHLKEQIALQLRQSEYKNFLK